MTDQANGRGRYPAYPFKFIFTYNTIGDCSDYEVTWKGRGRMPKQYELQVASEKLDNDGFSITEQRCKERNPRWAKEKAQRERLAQIRAERKADVENIKVAREARKVEREAKKVAKKAAAAAEWGQMTAG